MPATICLLAAIALTTQLPPDDEPPAPPIKYPVAETIVAEFQRGIPPHHPKHGRLSPEAKLAHNRVWTSKALKATFGDPSAVNESRTVWTWKRDDGTAIVEFDRKAYGNKTDPGSLRLQIRAAHFHPKHTTPGP